MVSNVLMVGAVLLLVCLLCVGEEPQEATTMVTGSSISASGLPKVPGFHIHLFLFFVNFNSGACLGAGTYTRSK